MVDVSDNVPKHMSVAWKLMVAYMARKLDHLQIGAGQYAYLFALYHEDGQSQQSLSDRLLVDKSNTVGAINKLQALGYIEKKEDGNDKRRYRIFLTPKGWKIKEDLEAAVLEALDILQEGFTEGERHQFLALLRRAAANMIRALAGPPTGDVLIETRQEISQGPVP